MSSKKDDIQLIGQGTYGCVYQPNIECFTGNRGSSGFLSKIQRDDNTTRKEIKIGKILYALPKEESNRFAPIIEDCDITVGELTKHNIAKCNMLVKEKSDAKFKSTKIRYAGNKTLGTFFQSELFKKGKKNKEKAEEYLRKLCNSHLYLLDSIMILVKNKIVHLDLKYDNVIQNKDASVIIDFGLSFDTKLLNVQEYKKLSRPFGIVADYYIPWCIEVIMLSHIGEKMRTKTSVLNEKDFEITLNDVSYLTKIFDNYKSKHSLLQSNLLFSEDERKTFTTNMHTWIHSLRGKKWSEIWTILSSTYNTWDNYSVAAMYLIEMIVSGLVSISSVTKESKSFLQLYINDLKQIILATPDKRHSPEQSKVNVTMIFARVKKLDYKAIATTMSQQLKSAEETAKMKKQRSSMEKKTLVEGEKMVKKANSM